MCRSWRCLIVFVWIVPHILAVIITRGSIVHLGWDRSGCRMVHFSSFWCVGRQTKILTCKCPLKNMFIIIRTIKGVRRFKHRKGAIETNSIAT